ncbi:MAG: HAD hydrolase family protein, partial [Alistipes sp.]|nr:HAD hydrolase family protein [Alistipes sp.]
MERHMGSDISQTMAFGDGGNDVDMIRSAGWGVAMGNATDELKAAADYITSSIDDDGIARAIEHFESLGIL